jgi:hypothetical protein
MNRRSITEQTQCQRVVKSHRISLQLKELRRQCVSQVCEEVDERISLRLFPKEGVASEEVAWDHTNRRRFDTRPLSLKFGLPCAVQEKVIRNPQLSREERLMKAILSINLLLHSFDLSSLPRAEGRTPR